MSKQKIKNMVRLVSVKSVSKMIDEVWHDNFKIEVAIDGESIDFETDLKSGNGIMAEVQKIFPKSEYNYSKFDSKYSRTPKTAKSLYED